MMTLITINRVYYLIGFVVMLLVVMTLRDRANPKRFTTALFWFLFGGIFLFGDLMVQELGKSLAYRIIGGGVAGLSTAWQLARKGHDVTVYDDADHIGGKLEQVIPRGRLSHELLESELKRIESVGGSIGCAGSACSMVGSHSVSATVASVMPATATMSPGSARGTSTCSLPCSMNRWPTLKGLRPSPM